MLKKLIELFIKTNGRKPNAIEMLQLKFKAAQQSGKGKVIEFPKDRITDWRKPRPTTGQKGEVIDTSFKPGVDTSGKRVTMSNDSYADLKNEWFTKIIANTDDDINTWLKKGDWTKSDERFLNLTPNQREDFLDMVQYRIKHGNRKFMNDFTDAKGDFKFPEDLAGGGRAGYEKGLKVYPRVSAVQTGETPNGLDVGVREVDYGLTGILSGNNWFGGMEGSKGNVKVDVQKDGDTLFKDTMSKEDTVNFIAGLGNIEGDKFQIKTDKDFENISIVFKKTFAGGGIAGMLGEPTYQDEDHRVPYSSGKFVFEGLPAAIKKIMEKFGKKSITTADKVKRPLKAIEAEDTKAMFDNFNNKIATQEALAKGSKKMAGPIKTKNKRLWDPESTDKTTWLQQEKFFDPKALDYLGKKVPSNWIALEREKAKNTLKKLGPLPSRSHPNWEGMRQIRQGVKNRLTALDITEELGGNVAMFDYLRIQRGSPEKFLDINDYIRKVDAPVVKDELSGIKKAFMTGDENLDYDWIETPDGWVKKPGSEGAYDRFGKKNKELIDKGVKNITAADELRREFPGIDDNLIKNILADDNPQRIAEVKATLKEALKMQEKGMGTEEIINIFKKKPTKHASGGLAGMLGE